MTLWHGNNMYDNLQLQISFQNDHINLRNSYQKIIYQIHPDFSAILTPLTAKLFNLNFHPLEVVSR